MLQDKALLGFLLSAHAIPSYWDRIQSQLIKAQHFEDDYALLGHIQTEQSRILIDKKQGIPLREHEKGEFCRLILRH